MRNESNLRQAWMSADMVDGLPFYRIKALPYDTAETVLLQGGNFYLNFSTDSGEVESSAIITDPTLVFGNVTDFTFPAEFLTQHFTIPDVQVSAGYTPCAFGSRQVTNEYDHLMEYGEEQISEEDAVRYFMFLKDAMEEYGIGVPKFVNEAEFLRGKGIIDTRTYYPNIPGLWSSEYERFEQKLLSSKETQPDAPVMILELQAGWFSQIGEPSYVPGVDVIEGVSKSVFIAGASIVNYYTMAGGTSFPFMGGRGDMALGGYGNITSLFHIFCAIKQRRSGLTRFFL